MGALDLRRARRQPNPAVLPGDSFRRCRPAVGFGVTRSLVAELDRHGRHQDSIGPHPAIQLVTRTGEVVATLSQGRPNRMGHRWARHRGHDRSIAEEDRRVTARSGAEPRVK